MNSKEAREISQWKTNHRSLGELFDEGLGWIHHRKKK